MSGFSRRSDQEEPLEYTELPRDPLDSRFVQSFPATAESLDEATFFFETYGFVVFSEVYSAEECAKTRSCMWDIIEESSPGFQRDDKKTWGAYSSAGKYGLGMRGPTFHPTLVNNRQNPNLYRALASIIGTEEVMVSHDRFTIYRATKDEASFTTGARNVHLDLNPWWWCESASEIIEGISKISYDDPQDFIKENNLVVKSMGRHLQCVLNFEDNEEVDGGTILVPKFHRHIEEWCAADNSKISSEENIFHANFEKEKQRKNLIRKQKREAGLREADRKSCVSLSNKASEDIVKSENICSLDTEDNEKVIDDLLSDLNNKCDMNRKNGTIDLKQKKKKKQKQGAPSRLPQIKSDSSKWGSSVKLREPLPWVIMGDDSQLLSIAQRVPLREGSVLMWDQTMVHGTQPNQSSDRCRMAMFLKAFDRTKCFNGLNGDARRLRRQTALKRFLKEGYEAHISRPVDNIGLVNDQETLKQHDSSISYLEGISDVGKRVFDM